MKRLLRFSAFGLGSIALLIIAFVAHIWTSLGSAPSGDRLIRISESPQFENGQFYNRLPPISHGLSLAMFKKFISGGSDFTHPENELPIIHRSKADFDDVSEDVRVTWLGHSTILVELEGIRLLIDPVFGDYASPNKIKGIKRYAPAPLPIGDLPAVDAIVISHDHYDHLDSETIRTLASEVPRFIVPLGIGSHLEYWGVDSDRIQELDWWEEVQIGGIRVVSTPARHFSGRSVNDRNATLWAGWAFKSQHRSIFYSGDSAMSPHFKEIGERLGPFDLTLMETGAYDPMWMDVHMGPEQAVLAHQDLRGHVFLPVHWGMFNLAFHGWTEPVDRTLAAAAEVGIPVALPRLGESITLDSYPNQKWWPDTPWQTKNEVPITSSGLK